MFKVTRAFRIIKSAELQFVDDEWREVYRAQVRTGGILGVFGKWIDVKKPQIYNSDSPFGDTTYTEVRHVPATFSSIEEARNYCVRINNPPVIKHQNWDVVSEFVV